MYHTIMLSIAIQQWEQYSRHALAVREVAATLVREAMQPLYVLSVYAYDEPLTYGLSPSQAAQARESLRQQTDALIARRMEEFLASLQVNGCAVQPLMRVGNPREVILQVAAEVQADLLIIGSHSKRGVFDVALGGTARYLTSRAPCTVLLVSPQA